MHSERASFLVSDYPDTDAKHLIEKRLELYGSIKLHIGDPRSEVNDNLPSLKSKFLKFEFLRSGLRFFLAQS